MIVKSRWTKKLGKRYYLSCINPKTGRYTSRGSFAKLEDALEASRQLENGKITADDLSVRPRR